MSSFDDMPVPTKLSSLNGHPRDSLLQFYPEPHIYTVNGEGGYTSVTTWNHSHFKEFDADKIRAGMMQSPKWPSSKYYGLSAEEIKDGWEKNRNEAATLGTKLHYDIECFYNDYLPENFDWNQSRELSYFNKFLRDWGHLEPHRTEWMVFDEELKLAGSVDMTFKNPDGSLQIYDWKRSKQCLKVSRFGECSTTECISHLPDTNFWHYSLQLNTYRYILEKNYGQSITDMYLVFLHPDNDNDSYKRVKVADLREETIDLMNLRKKGLMDTA